MREHVIQKTRGFFAEFRDFAIKGNALELAIAVVIGTAFTAIVNSLVGDIITPLIGLLTPGSSDLKNMSLSIPQAPTAGTTTPVIVHYGSFLAAIVNFLLISLSIFIVFKIISSARRRIFKEGEKAIPEHEKPAQERLLEEIRDLLKSRRSQETETPTKASEDRK